jgi:hypothetical protein
MAKNGKKIGSAFERDIARFLTYWVSGQKEKLHFWRSPGSGAVATISKHMNVSGDIVGLTPEAELVTNTFSIELKKGYPDTNFFQYFKKCGFNIEGFWKQCCNDATKSGKEPLLIYKKPPAIVGVGEFLDIDIPHMTLEFDSLETLKLYEMKAFFDTFTYEDLKILCGS